MARSKYVAPIADRHSVGDQRLNVSTKERMRRSRSGDTDSRRSSAVLAFSRFSNSTREKQLRQRSRCCSSSTRELPCNSASRYSASRRNASSQSIIKVSFIVVHDCFLLTVL